MSSLSGSAFRVGAWSVDPRSGRIARDGESLRVDDRSMRLLVCLAEHAGRTVTIDQLLDEVWAGAVVSQDSVYQAVTSLRRLLGDDRKEPAYIATVPRQGYRLVASVMPDVGPATAARTPPPPRRRLGLVAGCAAVVAVAVGLVVLGRGNTADTLRPPSPAVSRQQPRQALAVLPFLDLTSQAMNEEYVADGVTEELITRLSRMDGWRVSAPTDSFALKGKTLTVAQTATALDVDYLVDGSLRRSGDTLRISARVVRAADGSVVWSQSYDRSSRDLLQVQDDIAGEVAEALGRCCQGQPQPSRATPAAVP
ncbi:winged helix-turn-helix domain-containing protein [Caulobacter sp. BE254]|uniref:winged helix-turn-helix domain-containing protein n=1 Tax=Caulobacter sp. BE254 TaxID=2817720 RepID=UPI0028663217|nr:winged helix-turn-helix domain-containing protein [Caulobacter sp. BE254]MDR7118552.1 TolB-like protein/DNA-binding winged helix-turn-helix (wHTH) protein [Caulobacter sp. BE254]